MSGAKTRVVGIEEYRHIEGGPPWLKIALACGHDEHRRVGFGSGGRHAGERGPDPRTLKCRTCAAARVEPDGVEWRLIPSAAGYAIGFKVSSDGYSKNRKGDVLGIQWSHLGGYAQFAIRRADGSLTKAYMHRVVCMAFHGMPTGERTQACHIDGNVRNNAASNIRWGTRRENALDAIRHGTTARGERHGRSVLVREQVLEIRAACKSGAVQREVAARFGVTQPHVSAIMCGRSWSHLHSPE